MGHARKGQYEIPNGEKSRLGPCEDRQGSAHRFEGHAPRHNTEAGGGLGVGGWSNAFDGLHHQQLRLDYADGVLSVSSPVGH